MYPLSFIVGYNKTSLDFFNTLNEHVYYGYKCVGFINEESISDPQINYLGRLEKLEIIFSNQHIDEVIISLPHHQHGHNPVFAHRLNRMCMVLA